MLDRDISDRTPSGYGAPRPTKGVAPCARCALLCPFSSSFSPSRPPPRSRPTTSSARRSSESWGQSPACAEGHLSFKADGTFESKGAGDSAGATGTYTIDQGHLSGRVGDTDMEVVLIDFDGETLVIDDSSGNPQRLERCQAAQ